MFADPLGTASVALPPAWAFDPRFASLTRLAFFDWTAPAERRLLIDVGTAFNAGTPEDSDERWERIMRKEIKEWLPVEPTRLERRPGPLMLAEIPHSQRHPGGARLAWLRGARVGAFIEQRGSPPGGALCTPELEEAIRTIEIPANRHTPGRQAKGDWQAHIGAAIRAQEVGNADAAHDHLERAIAAARDGWLRSLATRGAKADIPAAVAQAEATLAIAEIERQPLVRLYHATTTLFRCRVSIHSLALEGTRISRRTEQLTAAALKMHARLDGSGATIDNSEQASVVRAGSALREFASLSSDSAKANRLWVALSNMATLACEDAMTAAALSASALYRNQRLAELDPGARVAFAARGITDDAQLQRLFKGEEIQVADLLSEAAHALSSVELAFASVSARAAKANAVLAARHALTLEPSAERKIRLIKVITGYLGSLFELGDEPSLEEAGSLLAESHRLLDQIGDDPELRALVRGGEAELCYLNKRTDNGLVLIDRAVSFFASLELPRTHESALNEAKLRCTRSRLLIQAGRTNEALEEARRAGAAIEDKFHPVILETLATVYQHIGDSESATNEIRTGLSMALVINPMSDTVQNLLNAAIDILAGSDTRAWLAALDAAELLLDVRRADVGGTTERIAYDDNALHRKLAASLVGGRLAAHDPVGAFLAADRRRARSLAYGAGLGGTPGAHHYTRKPPPKQDASISEQISFIAEMARSVQREWGLPVSLDREAMREVIVKHGRTIVLFHPVGEVLQAFVVRPEIPLVITSLASKIPFPRILGLTEELRHQLGITVVARVGRGELPPQSIEELAAAFVDEEANAETDAELDRLEHELHDALFSEVLPLLHTDEPLVVVPYRELSVIPLAVLTDGSGQPLAERHPLSVLPSIASLAALRNPGAGLPRAVVVGDPALPRDSRLPPLTGAAREAEKVTQILEGSGIVTKPLLGPDATEQAFRTRVAGAGLVHLACHAAVREPASSSPLFLAPDDNDDGLLFPPEVADLQLDGALVVLSACESGLGRVTADGILGLGRAFMQAGARVVVPSLWRVSDPTTAILMETFYRALTGIGCEMRNRLDVAGAMRYAQLAVRRSQSGHPSSWGPWLVIGDGSWRLPA